MHDIPPTSRTRHTSGRRLARLASRLAALTLAGSLVEAQERAPDEPGPDGPAATPTAASGVREVGGRLVVSGETVDVVADADEPPRASSVATKTDTPLIETPRSVTVFDRAALDELQAINVTQAHDYAPGFTPEDERGPGFERGFRVGFYDLRRDGLRTYTWSVREPIALDRIQYLRGPAAVLYGDGSPGGLVNLVLKKPLPERRGEASLSAGELGYLRATGDVTGPLTMSRSVRYRLVGAAEALENGFENGESRVSVLPMLSFDFGQKTTLHVDGEYYRQRGRGYRHTVPQTADTNRGDFSALPWDLNMASPDDTWTGWNASAGLRLDVQASGSASVHVAARYTRIDGDLDLQGLAGLAPDGRTALRLIYRELSVWDEYQSDSFAAFAFATGAVTHRVVTGFELGFSTFDTRIGVAGAPPLDIYDPVYAPRPAEPALNPTGGDLRRFGVYAQDQIGLGRLTLVPAVRASRLRLENDFPASSRPKLQQSDDELTPSFGAVFMARPWLSVYASWGRGFEPPVPGQFLETGGTLEPVSSESLEGGVKADLGSRRLSLSLAAFRIRQTGVAEADVRGFYSQIAEGESRGFELELTGSPAPGLMLRGAYAWTPTQITQDASGFAGNELPNAPEHKASLWARYRIGSSALRGLELGAGIVHVSSRFTTRANNVVLPAYTRCDVTASRPLGSRLTLALGVQNLTNARYVTSGAGRALFAGPPRRFSAALSASF